MTQARAEWAEACVSLGSNLGDRRAALATAVSALRATAGIEVVAESRTYETDPVGPGSQGPYLNGAVRLRTTLSPRALLDCLLGIEAAAGRRRTGVRNEARVLDLDLLLFADRVLREPGLEVPHPRLHERAFVLAPLADVAPDWIHPRRGERVRDLASEVHDPDAVRPIEP